MQNNNQLTYLKERLNMFVTKLDQLEPEKVELDEIDQLLSILDDLEKKCEEIKK
ncbi:MAG: hypothetical protein K0S51_1932 [Bacillales bacterium]|jgi:hypothetical protein|nr:hypothetical protein [Bacillales bacterium]MDF2947253.1 hypothetical protein [Bacillales bacterium]